MISKEHLWRLRNAIPLADVLAQLQIPTKWQEGYLRFLCPGCGEFNTAVNPKTNLGRCFRCEANCNAIDLTMIVNKVSFIEAVDQLEEILPEP